MKRSVKIAALAVSHLAVFAIAALVTHGAALRTEWRRAESDPLVRLGMRFEAPRETLDSRPSLEDEVRAASRALGPATQQVLQLVGELRSNDMTGATRTCGALGWRDCEPATLDAMRKALVK